MKTFLSLIFLFCLFSSVKSQVVVEILDNNHFKLDNGKIIRIADLYIPTEKEPNRNLRSYAHKITQNLEYYLLNKYFTITYKEQNADSTFNTVLTSNYLLGGFNVGERLLSEGYAINLNPQNEMYTSAENKAKWKHLGFWGIVDESEIEQIKKGGGTIILNKDADSNPMVSEIIMPQNNLKHSTILLPVALIGTALSINSFLDAGDVSDEIDNLRHTYPNENFSSLEKQKNRKIIWGTIYGISALVSFVIAMDDFNFVVQRNSLELSYKFKIK